MSDHITPEELHRLAANESIISAVLKWAAANGRRLTKADLERMGQGVDAMVAENERLTKERDDALARVHRLEEALDLVRPHCTSVHHSKKHQHAYDQPCPVVALIKEAKEAKP